MKFLLLMALCLSVNVKAAPVLNNNMAAEGTLLTIWPDHQNPDHFYFAPNSMKLALDKNNVVKFHLTEYQTGRCGRFGRCYNKGMITAFFEAGFSEKDLAQAQAGILKKNPKARFSTIPFMSSQVEFTKIFMPFIENHDCSPKAGQVSDEVPCTIVLNQKGLKSLKPFLKDGKPLPFRFVYQITGVIQGANNQYYDKTIDYGIAVKLGGEELINHEELE